MGLNLCVMVVDESGLGVKIPVLESENCVWFFGLKRNNSSSGYGRQINLEPNPDFSYNPDCIIKKEICPMTTIIPEGEDLQHAIKWISSNLDENASQSINKLVEKAVFKFDLSPKDADFLLNFYKKK